MIDGMVRSIVEYGSGFVEDIFNVVTEDSTLAPDEYYQNGLWVRSLNAVGCFTG